MADIERSLLPRNLPAIPGLELAARYQTRNGLAGNYYDFFELPQGRWGVLDRRRERAWNAGGRDDGHPAQPGPRPSGSSGTPLGPEHVNRRLATRYTADNEVFVTAFYGIYDPAVREFLIAVPGTIHLNSSTVRWASSRRSRRMSGPAAWAL